MNFVDRVVFDTSTLISAVLRPTSVTRQTFTKALYEAQLCASASTLAELEHVLSRDKFDHYLDLATRMEFFDLYRRHTRLFQISEAEENTLAIPCRDARDNKFLALALACSAKVIVTSDDDLLTLNPYQEIPVVTARGYLEN